MPRLSRRLAALAVCAAIVMPVAAALAQEKPPAQPAEAPQPDPKAVIVFADASLKNTLDALNDVFTTRMKGPKVIATYGTGPDLLKQIESGARVDVFVPADPALMDTAVQRKLVNPASRFTLAGNRLVLVAPKDSKLDAIAIEPGLDIAKLAGDGRIAVGNSETGGGSTARAALDKLGAWTAAEQKLAIADNMQAALGLVARSEAALGIAYETDAKVEPNVKIIGTFPANAHPEIIYAAASARDAKPDAARYLAFLRSATGVVVFEYFGFRYLVPAGP